MVNIPAMNPHNLGARLKNVTWKEGTLMASKSNTNDTTNPMAVLAAPLAAKMAVL